MLLQSLEKHKRCTLPKAEMASIEPEHVVATLEPTCSILDLKDNEPFIAGSKTAAAFLGKHVAVIVSDDGSKELTALLALCRDHPSETAAVVHAIDELLELFHDSLGKWPARTRPLEGRIRCEVAFISAAGLAHHGVSGIACGPAFLESSIRSHIAGKPNLHHVFTYEFCRNFIFPEEFTPVFDYRLAEGPACWGWVNQGCVGDLKLPCRNTHLASFRRCVLRSTSQQRAHSLLTLCVSTAVTYPSCLALQLRQRHGLPADAGAGQADPPGWPHRL